MPAPLPLVVEHAVQHALSQAATVLTPNQRISRALQQAHAQQLLAGTWQGLQMTPAIMPLEAWLTTQWQHLVVNGHDTRMLLSRVQENALWTRIVSQSADTDSLVPAAGLADLAARAWRLLQRYVAAADAASLQQKWAQTFDTQAFAGWSRAFTQQLRTAGYITAAELPRRLALAHAEGQLQVPDAGLLLIDFEALAPAVDDLLTSIDQAGYPVIRTLTRAAEAEVRSHEAVSATEEIAAAAAWMGRHLERNPAARLALVVPAQEARRAELDRMLHAALAPGQLDPNASAELPYEFSLGTPLLATACVSAAFELLRWPAEALPLPVIGTLLLSPFFGAAAGPLAPQALAAAEYDAYTLREKRMLRPELTAAEFLRHLESDQRLPALQTSLRRLLECARQEGLAPVSLAAEGPRQSYAGWTEAMRRSLSEVGWSAAATHADSYTFQAHSRWESLLDELATLDFEAAQPTAAEALAELRHMAASTIFAPESHNAAVQIVGPLEVGGVPFDALWFLGADDLNWPPVPALDPLLPFALQTARHMPGADAARDREAAQALTRRIAESAAQVVFSFARHTAEAQQRPSALIEDYSALVLETGPAAREPRAPERFEDTAPLPGISGSIGGGAYVLQVQAACGFRAFAELRLHATEPGERNFGLNARERGSAVHLTMERFWGGLGGQDALRALPLSARRDLLSEAIRQGFEKATRLTQTTWDEQYLAVERERLQRLLGQWLEQELARPHFTLAAQERELKDFAVGPLLLNLRVDRVDETGDGYLILDYKTGEAKPSEWLTDRPEAPQLPLYATVLDNVAGVAFAQLRAGNDMQLCGFADSPAVLSKPARMQEPSFAEQVDAWRAVLATLAEAFARGDAQVAPRTYPGTCKHCAQRLLCRVDSSLLATFDDGDEADNG